LVAVSKFGWRRRSTHLLAGREIGRDLALDLAPFGIRPAVGVFTVTEEPLLPEAFRPPTTRLPWASA
jgi:hypothetical protein